MSVSLHHHSTRADSHVLVFRISQRERQITARLPRIPGRTGRRSCEARWLGSWKSASRSPEVFFSARGECS